jgi:hypothetical protein
MQRVQSLSVTVVPSISVFTFLMFGFQVRRDLFLAWLTLLPEMVCLPQISHVREIYPSLHFV